MAGEAIFFIIIIIFNYTITISSLNNDKVKENWLLLLYSNGSYKEFSFHLSLQPPVCCV